MPTINKTLQIMKFRAWDNVRKIMDYTDQDLSVDFNKDGVFIVNSKGNFSNPILMPFTNLYDNTQFNELSVVEQNKWLSIYKEETKWMGREIYEYDILICKCTKHSINSEEFPWNSEPITFYRNNIIEWWKSYSAFGYRFRDSKGKTMNNLHQGTLYSMEAKIIGNIYESPTLFNPIGKLHV